VITGASSGIGEALALYYAERGARLGLIGRNQPRLQDVAARCRAAGASEVEFGVIDVRARAELHAWIANFDGKSRIDLLIAGAGIVGGVASPGTPESAEVSRDIFATNVLGAVNAIDAVLPGMLRRGSGQIAVVSSLAGFVSLPDLPSYSASKTAILKYALSLRDVLGGRGIRVNVACPGFVDTPMAGQLAGYKPFLVAAPAAAEAIARGLARDQRIIAFPFPLAWLTRLAVFLPGWLVRFGAPSFRVTARRASQDPVR
jgi:short-subunit dehydrogenase